jgi:hypothetical protein
VRSTKALLLTTVGASLATGVALLTVPTLVAPLLFRDGIDGVGANAVARIAGLALISIGVICFFARDTRGPATNGILTGLLTYNASISLLLTQFALEGEHGFGLWPAVAFHLLMASWCLIRLRAA